MWYAPWTPFGPLCQHVHYVDIQEVDMEVKDVLEGNQWCLDNLLTNLPAQIKEDISRIHVHINQACEDTLHLGA